MRTGSVLLLAITILAIAAVLVVSLYDVVINRQYQTYRMVDDRLAEHLCQSLLEITNYEWQKAVLNPDFSPIKKRLQTSAGSSGQLNILEWSEAGDFKTTLDKALKNYIQKSTPSNRKVSISLLSVGLDLCDVTPLGRSTPEMSWSDPGECIGTFSFKIHVAVNKARKKLVANRSFQIVNHLPGPIGRFTLFVKDTQGANYNVVENNADGTPISGDQPLVCYHGENDSLEKNGWVYLGGNATTVLNLTYGYQDTLNGEYFHFLRHSDEVTGEYYAGKRLATNAEDFLNSVSLDNYYGLLDSSGHSAPLFARLLFEEKYFGFFKSSSQGDMNLFKALDHYFSGQSQSMKSSILHLSGSLRHPVSQKNGRTPTYVLGKVQRLYALFRLLRFDICPTDGKLGTVAVLKYPAETVGSTEFWEKVNGAVSILGETDTGKDMLVMEPDQDGTEYSLYVHFYVEGIESLFKNAKSYLKYASDLVNRGEGEPFNAFLKTYFSDDRALRSKLDINDGASVTMCFSGSDSPRSGSCFSGDLSKIPGDLLQYKAVVRLPPDEFQRRYVSNGKLALRVPVEIQDASGTGQFALSELTLADDVCGMVFFEKDIFLNRLTSTVPAAGSQGSPRTLTFCSLKGNITLNSGEEYQSNLVALNGEVRSEQAKQVVGSLAVGSLPPDSLRKGKRLEYAMSNNPEGDSYGNYDLVYLSDKFHSYMWVAE